MNDFLEMKVEFGVEEAKFSFLILLLLPVAVPESISAD